MVQLAKNYWMQVPPSQGGTYHTEQEANTALPVLRADPRNADYELEVHGPSNLPRVGNWHDGWLIARRFRPEVWAARQEIRAAQAKARETRAVA